MQAAVAFSIATPSPANESMSASLSPLPNAATHCAGTESSSHSRLSDAPFPASASAISISRGDELVM